MRLFSSILILALASASWLRPTLSLASGGDAPSAPLLTPQLVKDINTNTFPANPSSLTPVGNTLFFVADDGLNGAELWTTDGTMTNTVMVKDINPGSQPSQISAMYAAFNKVFFFANDGIHGLEPWVSDGTPTGTVILGDLAPEGGWSAVPFPQGPYPIRSDTRFNAVQDRLVVVALDETYRQTLWRSDRGVSSLTKVMTFELGEQIIVHTQIVLSNTLYFMLQSPTRAGLWRSDGTAAGTQQVIALPTANIYHSVNQPVILGDKFLFAFYDDSGHGYELWQSDGTAEGTHLLRDLFVGPNSSLSPYGPLYSVANHVFFPAINLSGEGLWVSDGSPTGTQKLLNASLSDFVSNGTVLYFLAHYTNTTDVSLMRSDGTISGTQIITTMAMPTGSYLSVLPQTVSGTVYVWRGNWLAATVELWKSDGSLSSTVPITTLPNSLYEPNPQAAVLNNHLIFSHNGELWQSDGSTTGTFQIFDVNQAGYGSQPEQLKSTGNRLFFTANDALHNIEVWSLDGAQGVPQLATDVNRDIGPGYAPRLLAQDQQSQFFATIQTSTLVECAVSQLYRTDGSLTSTVQLSHFSNNDCSSSGTVEMSEKLGSRWFFAGSNELWRTDGTISGTTRIIDFSALNPKLAAPNSLRVVGNGLFFYVREWNVGVANSMQLWYSDGTAAGTHLVKAFINFLDSNIALNGRLLFFAYTPTTTGNYALWTSDGTTAGTKPIRANLVSMSTPVEIARFGDKAYFIERSGVHNELWQTDGTVSGTQKLVDLPSLTSWNSLYAVKDQLLLREVVHQQISPAYPVFTYHGELWRVNPVSATLDLLWRGEENQFVTSEPIYWRDKIVFATTDHIRVTNQTFTDTYSIANVSVSAAAGMSLAVVGSDLFLNSNSWRYGVELFKLSPSALSDPYLVGPDMVGSAPQGRARIYIQYGNLGAALPPTGTVAITAMLGLSLTYLSDSFGVSPTLNGSQLVWQVPTFSFLEQRAAYLEVSSPDAEIGSRYPITLSIATSDFTGNPNNTVLRSAVMMGQQLALPVALRF